MKHCSTNNKLWSSGPPLLALVMLLLLPGWTMAQTICFDGLNAGDDATWCEGEIITLDGGYASFDDSNTANPNTGTATVTWINPIAGGEFFLDGISQGVDNDITAPNFANSESGIASPVVTYGFPSSFVPVSGGVDFQINANSDNSECQTISETVTIFIDPLQEALVDVTVDGSTNISGAGSAGNGQASNATGINYGESFDVEIINLLSFTDGFQFSDDLLFNYTITGAENVRGLPSAVTGRMSALDINNLFNELTLTASSCVAETFSITFVADYERNSANNPQPSGSCAGQPVTVSITVQPRPEPTATIGADQLLEVCEYDDDFKINITGTANTYVEYSINGQAQTAVTLNGDGRATIIFDASQYTDLSVNVVLTAAGYSNGPACESTFSKPLPLSIISIPSISIELTDPEDAIICNRNNGGPETVNYTLTTNAPAGTYLVSTAKSKNNRSGDNYTIGFTATFIDNLDGTASWSGTLPLYLGDLDVENTDSITYRVTLFNPENDNNAETAECINFNPNASLGIKVQRESYVAVELDDSEGGKITLRNRATSSANDVQSANVTFCDGEAFSMNIVAPDSNNALAAIAGSVALLDVQIVDADGVLNEASGIYNFTDNKFSVDQMLDIPNSQTVNSTFSITMTPFMDNDGNGNFDADDECLGGEVVANVTVRPAPTVTVQQLSPVCEGETVDVVITATESGVANLLVGAGGSSVDVNIGQNQSGGYTGTYTSDPLSPGNNMFTVTTFTGNDANCSATVNQMVMTEVEANPTAAITVDTNFVCTGEDFTVTLTGSGGLGQGYTFVYTVDSGPETTISTDSTTAILEFPENLNSGTIIVKLLSVRNNSSLACSTNINSAVAIDVEEAAVVTCDSPSGPICSGDEYTFLLQNGSSIISAINSSLYYSVVTTTTTYNETTNAIDTVVSVPQIYSAANSGIAISDQPVNMSGFNQTISIEATPFYYDDENGEPTAIGESCAGTSTTCSVVVYTMPMATLGGSSVTCENERVELTLTGPANGFASGMLVDEDDQVLARRSVTFDGGGTATTSFNWEVGAYAVVLTEVTDANGCENPTDFHFELEIFSTPQAQFAPQLARTVCEGDQAIIQLSGTPDAVISLTPANLGSVQLDGNGDGQLTIPVATQPLQISIAGISVTRATANGELITCTAPGGSLTNIPGFALTISPAPSGELVSNSVLCANGAPEIQFNVTTLNADPDADYNLVVNGITFNNVSNGDLLDFSNTQYATLSVSDTFNLESITEADSDYNCTDTEPGTVSSVVVIVNPIPEVEVEPYPAVICSGDDLSLVSSFSPATSTASANDPARPLYFDVQFTNGYGSIADDARMLIPATEDLNSALGLPSEFFNNSSTGNDDGVAFTVTPYFETVPDNPTSGAECSDDGYGTPVVGIDPAYWQSYESDGAMTLISPNAGQIKLDITNNASNGYDLAKATYTATDFVKFECDIELVLGENDGTVGDGIIDAFGARNSTIENLFTQSSHSGHIVLTLSPGEKLELYLNDHLSVLQQNPSSAIINNISVAPLCKACPGEPVAVAFDIRPELEAQFAVSSNPERVCFGTNATICVDGTPNTTVSVYLGNGAFTDVKLAGNGQGCFTTAGGLQTNTEFIITGVTTLNSSPECSRTFTPAQRPLATVLVDPAPTASVNIDPDVVCADEDAYAIITGTPLAAVTYTVGNDNATTTNLDGNGKLILDLPTANAELFDTQLVIQLDSLSITQNGVTCPGTVGGPDTLTIRPLPQGALTHNGPVCAGEEVEITFTAITTEFDEYTLVISRPDPLSDTTVTINSGGVALSAPISGTYSVLSIADGQDVSQGVPCTNTDVELSINVIVEETPQLAAAISGTIGTANIASDDPILNGFTALACDEATIETVFSSTTLTSDTTGNAYPLYVEINVTNNDSLSVGIPASVGTSTVAFTSLTLQGILDNVNATQSANLTFTLTPYYENGNETGTRGNEECAGDPLTFDITIEPAVALSIDAGSSNSAACQGDSVAITLIGTPSDANTTTTVTFSASNLDVTGDSDVTSNANGELTIPIGTDGTATINGIVGNPGTATINVSMVMVDNILGNISRACMSMPDLTHTIQVNSNPGGRLVFSPQGPICNGDSVEVIGVITTAFRDGDEFTFTVDGENYTVAVDENGGAVLFETGALTETTEFALTEIVNTATGCSSGTLNVLSTIEVEEVPAGILTVNIDGADTTISGGASDTFNICANKRVDVSAVFATTPIVGQPYVSVDHLSALGMDYYSLGSSNGNNDLPLNDFGSIYSARYDLITGQPDTVSLVVTYFIGPDQISPLPATAQIQARADCEGLRDTIVIIINPNPKTTNITAMVCSGEDVTVDLDDAIVNGLTNAVYSYTVESDAAQAQDDIEERATPGAAEVAANFHNTGTDSYEVIYTVTPFGPTGCQGNDFTLTLTVKPEPVISADQEFVICSGDNTQELIQLDNDGIDDINLGQITTYKVIAIDAPTSNNFVADAGNPIVGSTGAADFLSGFSYTNTTSENQSVTVTLRPSSSEGCIGEDVDITLIVQPEPVVANTLFKICSGNVFEVDLVQELTANQVGDAISFTRRSNDGIVPIYGKLHAYVRPAGEDLDPTDGYIVFGANGVGTYNSETEFSDAVIRDSLVNNRANGPVIIYYDVAISNGDGCEANTFTIEVQVLPERNATLNPIAGQTAVCAGESILLSTTFDGAGTPSYQYAVMEADAGVNVTLTPSAAGGEVTVEGSGNGNATIMVMATDNLGCVAMATRIISIGDAPEALTIDGPDSPCTGITTFYDVENDPTSTYVWSISNPAAATFIPDNTQASVDIQFNTTAGYGPFTLSVTETNSTGCTTTSEMEISLTDETSADFTLDADASTREVTFTEDARGSIQAYNWSYVDSSGATVNFSNDANPVLTFPGTATSFDVTLMVSGGCVSDISGVVAITKTVSFQAGLVTDEIQLRRGTNFISFDVAMSDRGIASVFSGVQGLISVSTFENGNAKSYDPNRPLFFNSLREINDDYGYVVVVDRDQMMSVSGTPLPANAPRPLDAGINYVGHCAQTSVSSSVRLSDLESNNMLVMAKTFGRNVTPNNQTYVPGRLSFFQSLRQFDNSIGYAIITNAANTSALETSPTESYDFVYGSVTGESFVPGDLIEILGESGNVVGTITTNLDGTFKATPLYGKADRPDGSVEGAFEIDESVSFRYQDRIIENALVFNGEFTDQELNLDFGSQTSTPATLVAEIYPNPVVEQATITLTTSEVMSNVDVIAMDVSGRIVAKLISGQSIPAGASTIEWSTVNQLPAGIYHVLVYNDGQLVPSATQRVVKR